MKRFLKYYGLTLLWALFVFIMCTINLGTIGESHIFFPGFDKLTHSGFIFVLVVLWSNGYTRQQSPRKISYKQLAVILLVAIGYGGVIELLQWKVFTWRDGDWADFFSDAIGGSMGAFSIIVTANALSNEKK
jgi:hypothetical protein